MRVKKEDFPNIIEYIIKDTKDPKNVKVKKKVMEFVDPSKQSIIGSTTFGNIGVICYSKKFFLAGDGRWSF